MSVFIELTTDAFAETFASKRAASAKSRRGGTDRARRPLRGLEVKDDTYAFLKIVRSDGSEIKLIDSSSPDGTSTQYSNFLLQSVSEARMEKHQIVETFGEPYIYFFGESPRFLDVSAVLVDSLDFNWYAEFWENYNKYFRGTRSVELGARTYLFYDDNVVEGYVLNAQAQKTSDSPLQARLNFRMYLTNYSNVTFVGDPNFPIRASVNLPASVNLTTADAFTAGRAGVQAATDAALQEARREQAATGSALQAGGFGGGSSLSSALRGGVNGGGGVFVDGVLANARGALNNVGDASSEGLGVRVKPLRGVISDNIDEYTALPPPLDELDDPEQDHDGQPEAEDFPAKTAKTAAKHGANVNNPAAFKKLGIGPRFDQKNGSSFGVTGSDLLSAGEGLGNAVRRGGLNGGLGFIGGGVKSGIKSGINDLKSGIKKTTAPIRRSLQRFDAGANRAASALNRGDIGGAAKEIFGNGVAINDGVRQGTGIGGGIPKGVSGGIGPDGKPGTLKQFTGGVTFADPNPYGASNGYGQGSSANGAALSVGGAPSAFSTTVAPGTLNQSGTVTESFNIGPNGTSSSENKTGIFA